MVSSLEISALSNIVAGQFRPPADRQDNLTRQEDRAQPIPDFSSNGSGGNRTSDKSDTLELSSAYNSLPKGNSGTSPESTENLAVAGQQNPPQSESTGEEKKAQGELTEEEEDVVKELQMRDREVRAHEQAHVSAGGGLITGGPTYSYQQGPDGRQYAVGGEVQIDNAPVDGDPEATIRKMQQVIRAALAPAEPSGQDQAVASAARAQIGRATVEKMQAPEEDEEVNVQHITSNASSSNPRNVSSTERNNQQIRDVYAAQNNLIETAFSAYA